MDNSKKILIVDDDDFTRQLVVQMLQGRDCRIFEANNGSEAIRLTREILPDLVIMDVIMPMGDEKIETRAPKSQGFSRAPDYAVMDVTIPGGNGIEAVRIIKREFPGLPVIGISGAESAAQTTLGARDYLQILRFVGAEKTLVKPVSRDHLLKTVDELLAMRTRFFTKEEDSVTSPVKPEEQEPVAELTSEHSRPVPDDLALYLNKEQRATISMMQNFGWKLLFVRRSFVKNVIAVMASPTAEHTAVIEKDGELNSHHNVFIRKG